ncbi:hypothetical protein [Viridibacillus arvi]|uniref:hypothetical protein n=1 Tax=Viridibacillus arvi TaxID=263475 RepID=UPI0034CDFFF5
MKSKSENIVKSYLIIIVLLILCIFLGKYFLGQYNKWESNIYNVINNQEKKREIKRTNFNELIDFNIEKKTVEKGHRGIVEKKIIATHENKKYYFMVESDRFFDSLNQEDKISLYSIKENSNSFYIYDKNNLKEKGIYEDTIKTVKNYEVLEVLYVEDNYTQ